MILKRYINIMIIFAVVFKTYQYNFLKMKKLSFLFVFFIAANMLACTSSEGNEKASEKSSSFTANDQKGNKSSAMPEHLTYDEFLKKVWNFEQNPQEWIYEGEIPCVIDFYADWCRPCKMVAPIMDELAKEYDGKIKVYKINVDKERQLASIFRVTSIPSVLFVPKNGKPVKQTGALKRDDYFKIVKEQLLKEK